MNEQIDKLVDAIYFYAKDGKGERKLVDYADEIHKIIESERTKAVEEVLMALVDMWNQYCGKDGHAFMTAGEGASEILMKYGLLKDEFSEAIYPNEVSS